MCCLPSGSIEHPDIARTRMDLRRQRRQPKYVAAGQLNLDSQTCIKTQA